MLMVGIEIEFQSLFSHLLWFREPPFPLLATKTKSDQKVTEINDSNGTGFARERPVDFLISTNLGQSLVESQKNGFDF
jgi:hypothetical protein